MCYCFWGLWCGKRGGREDRWERERGGRDATSEEEWPEGGEERTKGERKGSESEVRNTGAI